ncbi:hypothetical protein [Chryseobacterium sp.]|uniref:hypothetical protein n=1 Tax=Chryseobacterium sp. TaxID=1871047 RepID=UPI0025B9F553|nr:hypothetical protein [Chryseobacterium sp.]
MATYESLIKLKGSVGDLVFYTLNGKNVVRKKSGFNKTAYKKNPAYEKVRQNSSEFGHCSKVGKMIRSALEEYIRESNDPLLYQKFARLMTQIKDLDTVSAKGERTVYNGMLTEEGKILLRQFQLGKKSNLEHLSMSMGLWDKSLHLNNINADEISIVTLKVDFEAYTTDHTEQIVPFTGQTEASFDKQFSDDDFLFYFVATKRKGKITAMGFV